MMLPVTGSWPTVLIVKGIMCRAFQFSECDFISKSHQLVRDGSWWQFWACGPRSLKLSSAIVKESLLGNYKVNSPD